MYVEEKEKTIAKLKQFIVAMLAFQNAAIQLEYIWTEMPSHLDYDDKFKELYPFGNESFDDFVRGSLSQWVKKSVETVEADILEADDLPTEDDMRNTIAEKIEEDIVGEVYSTENLREIIDLVPKEKLIEFYNTLK